MPKKEPTKATSLRLDEDLWKELATVARADESTVSEVVREAIGTHIATRSGDPEFQKQAKKTLEEDIATFKRLAERLDGDQAVTNSSDNKSLHKWTNGLSE